MRSIIVFALPALLAPLAAAPARTATEDFARRRHAFDPTSNVAYAANFLADHYTAKRSWAGTVALYHSATPKYAKPYRKKVFKAWNDE